MQARGGPPGVWHSTAGAGVQGCNSAPHAQWSSHGEPSCLFDRRHLMVSRSTTYSTQGALYGNMLPGNAHLWAAWRALVAISQVQRCTLLSIKTGGCPETCTYCSQSSSWRKETGLKAEKLMDLEEVYQVCSHWNSAMQPTVQSCRQPTAAVRGINAVCSQPSVLCGPLLRFWHTPLAGLASKSTNRTPYTPSQCMLAVQAAVRARDSGSTRFCMGAAWRGPSQVIHCPKRSGITSGHKVMSLSLRDCCCVQGLPLCCNGMLWPNAFRCPCEMLRWGHGHAGGQGAVEQGPGYGITHPWPWHGGGPPSIKCNRYPVIVG